MENLQITNRIFIFLIPLGVSMASFVIGYFIVYFTMLEEYIQEYHKYSDQQTEFYFSLMTTLLPIGAFISAFFYDRLVERYGQNKVLKVIDLIAITAVLMQVVSIHTVVLSISRFLMGIFCGIASGLIPSFIVSLSPSFTSGIVGTYNQVAMALGMAFAYYIGDLLDNNQFTQEISLRIVIGFPLICLTIHIIVLFLFPFDTIERLISRRQNIKVRQYLKMVYGSNWKKFELEIRQHKIMPIQIEQPNKSTRDIYDEQNFQQRQSLCQSKKLNFYLLGIALAAANQLSGIFAILEYAKQLFLVIQEGDQDDADFTVLMLGFFQVLVTFLSGFFINKIGRRSMMLFGVGIIIVSLLVGVSVTYFIKSHESITIFVVFAHVFGYSISLGPICMLYAVQALQSIKLVVIVYWGLNILITLFSDFLIESAGVSLMFSIFAVCSICSFIFFYFYLVETKDVSRKVIREMIEGSKIQWQKSGFIFNQSTNIKKKEDKAQTL